MRAAGCQEHGRRTPPRALREWTGALEALAQTFDLRRDSTQEGKGYAPLESNATEHPLPPTVPAVRPCKNGCGRPAKPRRDALFCGRKCRVQFHRAEQRLIREREQQFARDRDEAKPTKTVCDCGPGALAVVDQEGDLACILCGCHQAHVTGPINGYDELANMMVTDGDGQFLIYRARKRRPHAWRLEAE